MKTHWSKQPGREIRPEGAKTRLGLSAKRTNKISYKRDQEETKKPNDQLQNLVAQKGNSKNLRKKQNYSGKEITTPITN